MEVKLHIPNKIANDSWLRDEKYKWFLEGYFYAMTQSRAIPTLAAIPPEELYFAVVSILRGANKEEIPIPKF